MSGCLSTRRGVGPFRCAVGRTSPLVGRRDPLGAGLRPGCAACPSVGLGSRLLGRAPVSWLAARRYIWRSRFAPLGARAPGKRARFFPDDGPTWPGPGPAPLLAWDALGRNNRSRQRRFSFGQFHDPS